MIEEKFVCPERRTMEAALERVKEWTFADAVPHLTQPLLIVHGENDRNIPLTDAHRSIDAAGSADKELRTFTTAGGGAEHVNTDDPRSRPPVHRRLVRAAFRHRATRDLTRGVSDEVLQLLATTNRSRT